MQNKILQVLIFAILSFVIFSCTDFREEEMPVSFGVDTNELSFSASSATRAVMVSSGKRWDVASKPEWISLQSISPGHSPYEWTANFSASANEDYNREGTITIKAGSDVAEIVVIQEGKKGKFIAVESVSLSPTELTLTEGENIELTFDIKPSNASIKDVAWKSSDQSVATVTQTGRVDAIAEGTARITITTEDGNKTAFCLVSVKAKVISVTGVSLDKTSLSLTEGDVYELNATVTPADASNKSVTWSSSNTSIATVSSSGLVTAKSAGSATITATTNDGGKKATCAVMVQAQKVSVTGVSLNKTSLTMTEGDTQTLTATVIPSNATDKSVTWSSSNTTVATVSTAGVVTAKVAGSATITVKTNDGSKTATCSVTVQSKTVSVNGVILDRSSLSLSVGDTHTLIATVSPSNATDKSVTWSSSNTTVATVSSSGVVTAKSEGDATITVTTNDGGKTASCAVTVQAQIISVTGVSLDKTSLSMIVGDTQLLTANVTPTNATDKSVVWSSSNTNVATVTSSGLVTAKMVGSAVITVSTKDGAKTATCSISVGYAIPIAIDLGLSVKWASFNIGAAKPEDTGYYYPWGETEPVAYNYGDFFFYTLDSYKWYNSSDRTLTKYCSIANYGHNGYTDNKTILDQNDDAAYVNLGTTWRMPTNEEFAQLKNNCTWKWTSTNGVSGYSVTGPNGNSIFLPAAGFGTMMEFRNGGTQGYYWSSSLRTDYPYYAYSFSFGSSSYDNESRDRSCILPIRPVTGAPLVSVTGVSLNKTSLTMTEGDTQTLTATVTPSNATDKSVSWSSSNTSVATVSSSGVITAKASGTATITVTTNDGGKKATCSVTVKAATIAVTGVSLNKTSLSMTVGDTQTLTATVTPSNATDKSVTWSSNNVSIASVSSSGVVTAKSVGSATITVTTNDGGKTATCVVTVQATLPTLASVVVSNIQQTSVSLSSGIVSEGDGYILEKGYCYGTSSNPDKDDKIVYVNTSWSISLNGLNQKTKYYVRAFATTQYGTAYSEEKSFTTSYSPVEFSAISVIDIGLTDVTISCSVVSYGGNNVIDEGFCYSSSANPTTSNSKVGSLGSTATATLSSLAMGTTYYFRRYVVNSVGTFYSEQLIVSTLSVPNNAIQGIFSVSDSKKVAFSKSSLIVSEDESLSFAGSQYYCIGNDNVAPGTCYYGSYYNGIRKYPTDMIATTFVQNKNPKYKLLGDEWSVLTCEEWQYLLSSRENAEQLFANNVSVNGVSGVLILPDNWIKESNSPVGSNSTLSDSRFKSLENKGAVFIPYAGWMTFGMTYSHADFKMVNVNSATRVLAYSVGQTTDYGSWVIFQNEETNVQYGSNVYVRASSVCGIVRLITVVME